MGYYLKCKYFSETEYKMVVKCEARGSDCEVMMRFSDGCS